MEMVDALAAVGTDVGHDAVAPLEPELVGQPAGHDHQVPQQRLVIGRRVRNVTPAAAARYIFGYTSAQDISDRTIQNGESQWTRAKSFDTFTPLGPYIETKTDPHDLTIQLFQNGQLRQNSNTSQLIFNCYELVSFVSTNMTLLPGDIILTGAPGAVEGIKPGDVVEVEIPGIGVLRNPVIAEQ